ncbi:MAG: type II toxin-antitoxin system VapC family toxin [Acetobacteraceae bacterium]|nr:type II toxin-antitoxin system VapC family toxin [Acetobacteraceae bacterium]
MYLVDTNVISAAAPTKAQPTPALEDWMDRHSTRLYLSAVTVAEVEEGIARARRTGAARKADRLTAWLETLLHLYGARILPLDVATARALGSLADRARGVGLAPGFADLAIAATAHIHDLTVLTRNLRHFQGFGISLHDPFATLPPDVA